MRRALFAMVLCVASAAQPTAAPADWRLEWLDTDFSRHSVPLDEIISGGPPKDGIPAIDERTHLMLGSKASWVEPALGPRDQQFADDPQESTAEWHERLGLVSES